MEPRSVPVAYLEGGRHLSGRSRSDRPKDAPDEWLSLSLIEIGSEPIFEYRTREGEHIAFSNASAGQQATALLKTLLNKPGRPVLIDQPEKDLDNPVMQKIVEQIWRAKQKPQIIFVSHNANLVVNGDAELVAWCDYRKAGDQSGGRS
jgi:chromosome segregation protein